MFGRKLYVGATRRYAALLALGTLFQIIPFSCGQNILRAVTPILLDDTVNILDAIVRLAAPLVLP